MNRKIRTLLFVASLLVGLFIVGLGIAAAQGGSRTEVTFPTGGLEYETSIPEGYELSVSNVITAPGTIVITLSAGEPFSYTFASLEAPAYSVDGTSFSAEIELVLPFDVNVIAVEGTDVEVTIVPDAEAKFTVEIGPSPPPPPIPTPAPVVTPTVQIESTTQVIPVELTEGVTQTLSLVLGDGDQVSVNGVVTGTVTMVLKSGRPFGVNGSLQRDVGKDGLIYGDIEYEPGWSGAMLTIEGTMDGQQIYVELVADRDMEIQLLHQPAEPKPAAPAAALPAKKGDPVTPKLPDTGGDWEPQPEAASLWERFLAWLGI